MNRCLWLALFLLLPAPSLHAQPAYPPPAEVRAAFKKLLDRPRVDLAIQKPAEAAPGTPMTFSFASEKKADGTVERVPVLIVMPAQQRGTKSPVVICLH